MELLCPGRIGPSCVLRTLARADIYLGSSLVFTDLARAPHKNH
jgi:hypothetical protein